MARQRLTDLGREILQQQASDPFSPGDTLDSDELKTIFHSWGATTKVAGNAKHPGTMDWMVDYVKANPALEELATVIDRYPSHWFSQTMTWLARIKAKNCVIPNEWEVKFQDHINSLIAKIESVEALPDDRRRGPKHNSNQLGELYGLIDDEYDGDWKTWMMEQNVGRFTLYRIISSLQTTRDELIELTELRSRKKYTSDQELQLLEAYRHLKGDKLTATLAVYNDVIGAAELLVENHRRQDKPRKTKAPSVTKITQHARFLDVEPITKIASLHPEKIVGATVVYAYDAEKRFLFLFTAEEGKTLTFNRTSIDNTNKELTFRKKVRKPEIVLPQIVAGGKRDALKVFKAIRAVEQPLQSTRTNENMVFLRKF